MEKPNIWIDSDLCSGCGNCTKIAPNIFKFTDAGFSVVHLYGQVTYLGDVFGRVLEDSEVANAIIATNECPGEIIVIDI